MAAGVGMLLWFVVPIMGQERKLIDPQLSGWEKNGDGIWTVLKDGTLIGQRPHPSGKTPLGIPFPVDAKQYGHWLGAQSWLYTKDEFDEFDLHVEYWLPSGGNSGVSIRDSSRGKQSYGAGERGRPRRISGTRFNFWPRPTPRIRRAQFTTSLRRRVDWN